MNGILAQLKDWITDSQIPELEQEFRQLLAFTRRRGLSFDDVNNMAETLWQLVQVRQRDEYKACREADAQGDFDTWLNGNPT